MPDSAALQRLVEGYFFDQARQPVAAYWLGLARTRARAAYVFANGRAVAQVGAGLTLAGIAARPGASHMLARVAAGPPTTQTLPAHCCRQGMCSTLHNSRRNQLKLPGVDTSSITSLFVSYLACST